MDNLIIETRGRKPKYDFSSIQVGERISFGENNLNNVSSSFRGYIKRNGLDWTFRAFTYNGESIIVRTK